MPATSFCEATPMTANFAKCSSTQFSASAQEFVPSFFSAAETPQFSSYATSDAPSYAMSDASAYAMSDTYQYNPYMMQTQGYQYAQYNGSQTSMASAGTCMMLSLDDYSDYSSDDEAQPVKPVTNPTLTTPSVEPATPTKPQRGEPSVQPATPNTSAGEPESDVCSIELDQSDNDQDCVQDGSLAEVDPVRDESLAQVQSFSVVTLLKLRHSVPPLEGIEEGLSAKELSPRSEPKPEQAPSNIPAQNSKRDRPPATKSDVRRTTTKAQTSASKRGSKDDGENWRKGPSAEELRVSESSWLAQQMAHRRAPEKSDGAEAVSTEEVVRRMKSILNKLTIEKFEPLYEKLVSCGIQTTVHLEALIHEVFEKATTQHHFVNMYADLCDRLHGHFSEHPITDDPKMTFKKILLNGCQAFFEKHLKPPADLDKVDEDERLVLTCKYKTQMLGNIKFVGALLVRQMLAAKVLFAICEELLGEPTPESLESLAALLTVVGPKFDIPEWQGRPMLTAIFDRVKVLTKKSEINCRVRCLLKDVLELRESRWQDRKPKKIEGPSTLKQVADTQAKEEKAGGNSSKAPANAARRSQQKSWPGQGQSGSAGKAGGQKVSSLATDLFSRSSGSPKTTPSKDSYTRINSLAALMGDRKDSGSERPRKQPAAECFDKEACRKEISGAIAELRLTHEVNEALLRISAISVPASKQSEELCDMLANMAEEGSAAARKASFELVAGLFTQGHWKPYALGRGLQDFVEEVCPDLKCDIPMLPTILGEELSPALAPLVKSGILKETQHGAIAMAC